MAVDSEHLYWANAADRIHRPRRHRWHERRRRLHQSPGNRRTRCRTTWPSTQTTSTGRIAPKNVPSAGQISTATPSKRNSSRASGCPGNCDIDSEHIFWANRDPGNAAIGRADIDGTGVDPAFIQLVTEPFGIVLDGVHVYWTNEGAHRQGRTGRIGRRRRRRSVHPGPAWGIHRLHHRRSHPDSPGQAPPP